MSGGTIQVRCAMCNEYYGLDKVVQHDSGYYCKNCLKILKRQQRIPDTSKNTIKCDQCGRAMALDESKVKDGSRNICLQCYLQRIKPSREDNSKPAKPTKETKCAYCDRALAVYDDKVQENGKIYCKACYEKARDAFVHQQLKNTGFVPLYNATTALRDTIVECAHCGMFIALEKLKEDADGKIRCPKCRKELPFRFRTEKKPKTEEPASIKGDFNPVAQLFKCLGDPCRVKIIESLGNREMAVFEFIDLTGFQYSAISYHLKMLKDFGLIESSKNGAYVVYSLTEKGRIVLDFIDKSAGL